MPILSCCLRSQGVYKVFVLALLTDEGLWSEKRCVLFIVPTCFSSFWKFFKVCSTAVYRRRIKKLSLGVDACNKNVNWKWISNKQELVLCFWIHADILAKFHLYPTGTWCVSVSFGGENSWGTFLLTY